MKTSILAISLYTFTMVTILTSCNSTAENVEKAEDEVSEANRELDEANEAYLADMENYKRISAERIAANEKSIQDFNERIEAEKKDAKSDYKQKIAELEAKNNDMKKRMEEYQANGQENWEVFKTEFNRDMDAIGEALKNFATTPSK